MEVFSSSYVWTSISQPRKNFKGQCENLLGSFFTDRFFLRWDGESCLCWGMQLSSCSRGGNKSCASWGTHSTISVSSWFVFLEVTKPSHFMSLLLLIHKEVSNSTSALLERHPARWRGKMIHFSASKKYSLFICCNLPLRWKNSPNGF